MLLWGYLGSCAAALLNDRSSSRSFLCQKFLWKSIVFQNYHEVDFFCLLGNIFLHTFFLEMSAVLFHYAAYKTSYCDIHLDCKMHIISLYKLLSLFICSLSMT